MGWNNSNNNLSDRENVQSSMTNATVTAKRFKLPKKFFDDSNGVDHSSVPRKLRSAMKKRNRESVSPPFPDSKKMNHVHIIGGVESIKKDGLKKSKLNMKQGSSDWSQKQVVGPITKDEEEVVETLYAMAGMFPDNDGPNKSILESALSDAKPTALPEYEEITTPVINDSAITKEELGSTFPLSTTEAAPLYNLESSQEETPKVSSIKESSADAEEKPDIHNTKSFHMNTDSCLPPVNVHCTMPLLAKREHVDAKPLCNPVNAQVLPELCLDSGLEQSIQKETSLTRNPELAVGATTIRSHQVQQDIVMESRKKGLAAIWPGLSPVVSRGAGSPGSSLQSSAAKIPAWLDAAVGASKPCSLENGLRKVCEGTTNRRSLKRCAAHVYISRLIRDLQMPENKEKLHPQCNQLKPPEAGQKQETDMVMYDLERLRKGSTEVISANNIGSTTVERNSSEAGSGVLQHKRLHHDTASGAHILQKQNFNFLSLSAGGAAAEATNCFNRTKNNALEPSSQFQVSYLHSLPHHQKFMPIAMPQTHYTSSYADKITSSGTGSTQQVQLQLLPYHSSPFLGPAQTSSTILKNQHQLQQQQLWAAQLAAQCRPTGHSTGMRPFSNWPNGIQDPTLIPCPQSLILPSSSSLEAVGPKYSSISQQQHQHQQLRAITSSLQPAMMKRQDHHLPLVYDEVEDGFRAGGSLPLQLMCNERL